jgi:hypothetical protein
VSSVRAYSFGLALPRSLSEYACNLSMVKCYSSLEKLYTSECCARFLQCTVTEPNVRGICCCAYYCYQRQKDRPTYLTESLIDDDIDGRWNFDLNEKLTTDKFLGKTKFYVEMKGSGNQSIDEYYHE